MEHRNIGSLSVSVVGLGCNNFGSRLDEIVSVSVVHAALDRGINFLDTADIYGSGKSEEYVGAALRGCRSQAVVATKFGMELDAQHKGARPEYAKAACEDSLRRLGIEHIDLYWLHQPDLAVPIADTLGALTELKQAGKVREIGCSNFTAAQLREAAAAAQAGGLAQFIAVQNEFSMLHREPLLEELSGLKLQQAEAQAGAAPPYPNEAGLKRGVLAECRAQGLAFVPYFPLASGMLTGKYRAGQEPPEGARLTVSTRAARFRNDENIAVVERLIGWAEARGHTLLELAFAWLLSQQSVASVIAGATKPEQVRANAAAAGWKLSDAERAEITELL